MKILNIKKNYFLSEIAWLRKSNIFFTNRSNSTQKIYQQVKRNNWK